MLYNLSDSTDSSDTNSNDSKKWFKNDSKKDSISVKVYLEL